MKKRFSLFTAVALIAALLAGCGSQEQSLVSKTPFPEFSEVDMEGNTITNEIFSDHDVTIVNFWSNGCGSCIEEMPELEEMYQEFQGQNINLIGVGSDSGESEKQLATAREILEKKGVTYPNISPNPENDFYKDFVSEVGTYPTTYIVDGEGNIIGASLVGNVKKQSDTLQKRIDMIRNAEVG